MAGGPQIEVTFDIDTNGIVHVSAKDLGTGKAQDITITAASNLSEADIEKAIQDAQQYESQDSRRKGSLDTINDAQGMIIKAEQLLSERKKELTKDQKNFLKNDIANLRKLLKKAKPETISDVETDEIKASADALQRSIDMVG